MDLITFKIPDFDKILGMDFLGRNEAKVDYPHKKVWFSLENGTNLSSIRGILGV